MESIRFLSLMDVIALHADAMAMSDQAPAALVRRDALESAIAQAKQLAWYAGAEAPEIAVHLTTRIALAHAFVDGNKRTAAYAGIQFAGLNGAHDPSLTEMITFAKLLIRYVESDSELRQQVLAEFIEFVSRWFD